MEYKVLQNLDRYKIILASQSPRRQQLLSGLELEFEIRVQEVDESYDSELDIYQVAEFISNKKSDQYKSGLKENDLLITSDTVVIWKGEILEKPKDEQEGFEMISKLSGSVHEVITGVSLTTLDFRTSFSETTKVHFNELTEKERWHYLHNYNPLDKAGSYGIQDFIGFIGIKKLEGCYYNVMGLPLHRLYAELKKI